MKIGSEGRSPFGSKSRSPFRAFTNAGVGYEYSRSIGQCNTERALG